ncbi:unnamed protein product [Prunus armeniaca]
MAGLPVCLAWRVARNSYGCIQQPFTYPSTAFLLAKHHVGLGLSLGLALDWIVPDSPKHFNGSPLNPLR